MKTRIKWVEGVCFLGETDSGYGVIMDGAADSGGRNLGPRPMEMLLLGLGGCTAFDVVTMLKKGREAVDDCVIEIEAGRADAIPKVFTSIHAHFIVTGRNLKISAVERAIRLSAEKYCSATAMLSAVAEFTHDFEVRESE